MADPDARRSGVAGIVGLVMLAAGLYLLLQNVVVGGGSLFGYGIYNAWGVQLTSGYALIPLMFGFGLVMYGRTWLGWTLTVCSAAGILFGVIAETRISIRYMTLFDLLVILGLVAGGAGLMLRAWRADRRATASEAEIERRVEAELRARIGQASPAGDPAERLRELRSRRASP